MRRRWRPFAGSWPGLLRLFVAAGLGAAMATGQAPWGLWWLAFPALIGLMALVATSERGAGWVAWVAGAAYFAVALNWIVQPFLIDAQDYAWMAPFAVVFLSVGLALFWAVAGWGSTRFADRAMGFALMLSIVELARGYVLTGFPWALIGHIWIGLPPAQLAALIGPSGLTLITVVAAAAFCTLRPLRMAGGAALIAAAWVFGLWQLGQPDPAARAVTLRIVQPDAEQQMKWDPEKAQIFFQRLLDYTAEGPLPDLTIWPETAVPYLLEDYPEVATAIAAAGRGNPVLTGIQRVEPAGWRFWNSLAVIGPGGAVTATYDKHHLVPFGEYIPFGDLAYNLLGLRAFAAQAGNGYTPGTGPAILDLGAKLGRALPLICYEAVFPQDLRAADGRADWILQITNDAWFGTKSGPYQHLAQAQLRAIEQGLPLVRAANTGISGVIDARGRILTRLGLGEQGFLDVPLPGALPITPYARWGEVPVLLLLGALALLLSFSRKRKFA